MISQKIQKALIYSAFLEWLRSVCPEAFVASPEAEPPALPEPSVALSPDACVLCGYVGHRPRGWVMAQTWTSVGRHHRACIDEHRIACGYAVQVLRGARKLKDAERRFDYALGLWAHVWHRRDVVKRMYIHFKWARASDFVAA